MHENQEAVSPDEEIVSLQAEKCEETCGSSYNEICEPDEGTARRDGKCRAMVDLRLPYLLTYAALNEEERETRARQAKRRAGGREGRGDRESEQRQAGRVSGE